MISDEVGFWFVCGWYEVLALVAVVWADFESD